jgi:gliding motility-associated-like protein
LVNVYNVKGILVPTAFTPNGDGLNDILRPFTIDIKQLNYFRIFNKWGQLIFESNNTAIGWDGSYQGAPQASGNYVWIAQGIDNKGQVVNQHGQVLLIR